MSKRLSYDFIKEEFKKHGYELLDTEYKNNSIPMEFHCTHCGKDKKITYASLQQGCECTYCSGNFTFDEVKEYVKDQGCEFLSTSYSRSIYRYKFRCSCGDEFETAFDTFRRLGKVKCNKCNASISKGEQAVQQWLDINEIPYATQYTFNDLKHRNKLRFDFCIFDSNSKTIKLILEFNGMQHYKPREFFGGIESFKTLKICDGLKEDYCKFHNIPLLIVKYDEFSLLDVILSKHILEVA